MKSSMERGKWVFFQNCHLAPSFMPALERLVEHIDPEKVRNLLMSISHSSFCICGKALDMQSLEIARVFW